MYSTSFCACRSHFVARGGRSVSPAPAYIRDPASIYYMAAEIPRRLNETGFYLNPASIRNNTVPKTLENQATCENHRDCVYECHLLKKEDRQIVSLGDSRIKRVRVDIAFVSMLTVRVVVLEYNQLHKKA